VITAGGWLIDTDVDARTTLGRMARFCRNALRDPRVIYAGNQVIAAAPARDLEAQVAAIAGFLESTFKFVPNPFGTQTIRPPGWTGDDRAPGMLEDIENRGMTQGACDDAAVLIATLAMANGIHARFRALAYCYQLDGACDPTVSYSHVVCDVDAGDAWQELDVTRPHDGTRPAAVVRTLTYDL